MIDKFIDERIKEAMGVLNDGVENYLDTLLIVQGECVHNHVAEKEGGEVRICLQCGKIDTLDNPYNKEDWMILKNEFVKNINTMEYNLIVDTFINLESIRNKVSL